MHTKVIMKTTLAVLLAVFWSSIVFVSYAQSAIIAEATSELNFRHSYRINNGSVPDGIRLSSVPGSLSISSDLQTNVNEPTAVLETANFVQVGNPFLTPALPFESRRNHRTTFNAGTEGAQSDFDISATSENDPDSDPTATSIVERVIDNSGGAEVVLTTANIAAQASASFGITRGYRLQNLSDNLTNFSIIGDVDFDLSSQYEGANGFANASMSVFTLFEQALGVSADFSLSSVYDPDFTMSGTGASVFESLTFNEPILGGFLFSGSTRAQGNGGDVMSASIRELFTYRLDLTMEAGSSFDFFTGFSQENIAEYDPQAVSVSAPSTLSLFCVTLLVLGFKRRQSFYE